MIDHDYNAHSNERDRTVWNGLKRGIVPRVPDSAISGARIFLETPNIHGYASFIARASAFTLVPVKGDCITVLGRSMWIDTAIFVEASDVKTGAPVRAYSITAFTENPYEWAV